MFLRLDVIYNENIVYINFFTIYLYNDTYCHMLPRKNELTFRCREKEKERKKGGGWSF